MEELVAELGAAFVCADLGLTPEVLPDHAAYLNCWLKVLRADSKALFTAAAHAERAAEFLAVFQPHRPGGVSNRFSPALTVRCRVCSIPGGDRTRLRLAGHGPKP